MSAVAWDIADLVLNGFWFWFGFGLATHLLGRLVASG
jgi:hypothetical protein